MRSAEAEKLYDVHKNGQLLDVRADNYTMSGRADNYTRSAKALSREADSYATSPRIRLDSYCCCCVDCFFFCDEAFWVDAEGFCPEPVGAWRTSAQGSGAF
jgi:hypothetical protein